MDRRYFLFKAFEAFLTVLVLGIIVSGAMVTIRSFAREKPAEEQISPSPIPTYSTTVPIMGRLRVDGTIIRDESGKAVSLEGVNYHELSTDYVTPGGCDGKVPYRLRAEDVKKWGFNVVRLTINWDSLEPNPPTWENGEVVHHWNAQYIELIDSLVSELTTRDIGVILDMHQYLWSSKFQDIESEEGDHCGGGGIPAWLYENSTISDFQDARCQFFAGISPEGAPIDPQEGFLEAWKFLAGRYVSYTKVIAADMINEPWAAFEKCTPEELRLNEFYEKVGKTIREVSPDIILIFEDSQDFDNGEFALSGPLSFSNTMYSFHLYTRRWQPDGSKRLNRYLTRAREWNVPLFVGEFNAFDYGNDENVPLSWKSDLQSLLAFFKQNDIHWTYWSYSGDSSLIRYADKKPKEELLDLLRKGL